MPEKASVAIPEKSLQERLEDAKALAENGGLMSFAGRAEIPLIEELMDLTAQLETAQGLYDDANRDWRAMKVRAEQAEATVARLSAPLNLAEVRAIYGDNYVDTDDDAVMAHVGFAEIIRMARLAAPEPRKEPQ